MVEIVGSLDVAQIVLYAFWVFFAGLIWYLQAESRREGYPLENDVSGEYTKDPWLQMPLAKTFKLHHGMGERTFPDPENRDRRPIAARRASALPGSPLIPTGNPLLDGVGPASWAERPDHPDLTPHGNPKIVPISIATHFNVSEGSLNPVGLNVVSADGKIVGQISDVWVDQSESIIRFYTLTMGAENRVIPMHFALLRKVKGGGREFYVHALMADQFGDAPKIAAADQITMLEEEKLMAYFGGGNLYATPERAESVI